MGRLNTKGGKIMRITDGTETMEVSVREYGDLSDREITDQTLPSLVEWAETPGIVGNVRRTAHRLVELFANDGKKAPHDFLDIIPEGAKLGLNIRLYAPRHPGTMDAACRTTSG